MSPSNQQDRVTLELAHVQRLERIEEQLKVARSEAQGLGLGTGAIDRALVALGCKVSPVSARIAAERNAK